MQVGILVAMEKWFGHRQEEEGALCAHNEVMRAQLLGYSWESLEVDCNDHLDLSKQRHILVSHEP